MFTHKMEVQEKQIDVFLKFEMENNTLSNYLGIMLVKVGTNDMYNE